MLNQTIHTSWIDQASRKHHWLSSDNRQIALVACILLAALAAAAVFLWAESSHIFTAGSHMADFGGATMLTGVLLCMLTERTAKKGDPMWHVATVIGFIICTAGVLVSALAWIRT